MGTYVRLREPREYTPASSGRHTIHAQMASVPPTLDWLFDMTSGEACRDTAFSLT